MHTHRKISIEVGLNESTTKAANPNVAYGPDEVAADAERCSRAGAAIVHFHARHDDGSQAWADADLYRSGLEKIAERCDVIAYPSYLGDHSHVWDLVAHPPAKTALEVASFDVVQELVAAVGWDEANRRFVPLGYGDVPTGEPAPPALATMAAYGLVPAVAAYDTRDVRWAALAVRAGLIAPPLQLKLFLGGAFVTGPWPSASGLDVFLSQLPADIDAECTVVPFAMTDAEACFELLRAALERGCNLRVGIGDNPAAHPGATNAELVARAAELIVSAGHEVATPADVRARLGVGSRRPADN